MESRKLDYIIKLTYDRTYKGYVADVINLYGCMSQGKTKQEALKNAEQAIKAFMETLSSSNKKSDQFAKRTVTTSSPIINA